MSLQPASPPPPLPASAATAGFQLDDPKAYNVKVLELLAEHMRVGNVHAVTDPNLDDFDDEQAAKAAKKAKKGGKKAAEAEEEEADSEVKDEL